MSAIVATLLASAALIEDRLMIVRNARGLRRGLSFMEFIGVFTALVGGVFLGAMYLGIDVKEAAIHALHKTQMINAPNDGPVASTQVAPAPAATSSAVAPKAADANAKVTASADASETKSRDDSVTSPAVAPAPMTDVLSLTPEQRDALTRDYWKSLDETMRTEYGSRGAALSNSDGNALFNFLSARHDGHQQAANAIAALNRRGVDAHVTAYGERALAWHVEGAKLFARAKDLLTDAPTAQLSGPFAQSWQSAATQHQMEERLLAEKHQAVQSYLDHKAESAK